MVVAWRQAWPIAMAFPSANGRIVLSIGFVTWAFFRNRGPKPKPLVTSPFSWSSPGVDVTQIFNLSVSAHLFAPIFLPRQSSLSRTETLNTRNTEHETRIRSHIAPLLRFSYPPVYAPSNSHCIPLFVTSRQCDYPAVRAGSSARNAHQRAQTTRASNRIA